jgi:hypothetical protein
MKPSFTSPALSSLSDTYETASRVHWQNFPNCGDRVFYACCVRHPIESGMPSEADTCRRYVVPLLQSAGWEDEPHSIAEQRTITDGRERAQQLRELQKEFFVQYGPEARQILDELLKKYAEHGGAQFVLPDVLKVPPISDHGRVGDIVRAFGGVDKLRGAVNQLQTLVYAA